jgi:hypothetical protein
MRYFPAKQSPHLVESRSKELFLAPIAVRTGDSIMTTKAVTGIAFALVTMLASPALAQSNQGNRWDAYHSYAQQYEGSHRVVRDGRRHSPHRSWDVYRRGRYMGSDPDPNVRDMIARDPEDEGRGW